MLGQKRIIKLSLMGCREGKDGWTIHQKRNYGEVWNQKCLTH